jgi:DNA polymerase III epsilon subunit-like protein
VEGQRVVRSFESLVDPISPIPSFATRVHGIVDSDVRGKPTLRRLQPVLRRYCSGTVVVAHNARFDLAFLPFLLDRPVICSWRLAARVVPEAPNHKNQTLGAFFDVRDPALEGRRPHRALADAIVTRHVFFHCLKRYLARGNPDALDQLLAFTQKRSERTYARRYRRIAVPRNGSPAEIECEHP